MTTRKSLRWAVRVTDWHPSASEWSRAVSFVALGEQERIGRFVFRRDAKSALVGRLLLRKAAHVALSVSWRCVNLERTERGRPFVPNARHFDLNVSHHGDWVLCAAEVFPPSARDEDEGECPVFPRVGVDVMKFECRDKTPIEFVGIFKRQLSEREWAYVAGGPETGILNRFYRIWCLKESFLKADGCGISKDLKQVAFEPKSNPDYDFSDGLYTDTLLRTEVGGSDLWRFHEGFLDHEHCWAVCLNSAAASRVIAKPFDILAVGDLTDSAESLTPISDEHGCLFMTKY